MENKKSKGLYILIGILAVLVIVIIGLCILFVGKKSSENAEIAAEEMQEVNELEEVDITNIDKTEIEEPAIESDDEKSTEELAVVDEAIEFDEEFIYELGKILPINLSSYNLYGLMDSIMIEIYYLEQEDIHFSQFPEVESGYAPTPVMLTYENLQVGEEAFYMSVDYDAMDNFLKSIYGPDYKSMLNGEDGDLNSETSTIQVSDGRLYEWGCSYITMYEGWWLDFDPMQIRQEDALYICTIPYMYGDFEASETGKIVDSWMPDADSLFGWRLLRRDIEDTDIQYVDVESDVNMIREWYYHPGPTEDRIEYAAGDGQPFSRQYSYHEGRLCFVFIVDDGKEYRFYYKDTEHKLIRYIAPDGTIEDFPNIINAPYEYLELIDAEG